MELRWGYFVGQTDSPASWVALVEQGASLAAGRWGRKARLWSAAPVMGMMLAMGQAKGAL